MGEAPREYTVQAVVEGNKVTFQGETQVFDVLPQKGGQLPALAAGQQLRGWLNPNGTKGPFFRIAEDRPMESRNGSAPSGRRDDATGRSIERQVALKCAAEFYAGKTDTPVATIVATAEAFDEFLDNASARSGGTSPPPASPAADTPGAGEGANTPAAQPAQGDGIPF